ncbi:MAG: hypothetical protein EXS42_01040 [Lacunisphaera sp.]|nr:hypothetical protein [Lacunisphaera sp.]
MIRFRILLVLLLLMAAAPVQAQPRDRKDNRWQEHDRGPRVILYQHADYRGDALVVYPGDSHENLSRLTFEGSGTLNDRISSIRVEGGAEVYVYENARYRGAVMRLTENTRDLTGRLLPAGVSASWNDRISSLRVEARQRVSSDKERAKPDVIIKQAYLDLLAREPDPSGLRNYRGLIIDQGWTELMVRDHIRRSDEFRREGADHIVRRAYLDLFGREPDPSGLKQYRSCWRRTGPRVMCATICGAAKNIEKIKRTLGDRAWSGRSQARQSPFWRD